MIGSVQIFKSRDRGVSALPALFALREKKSFRAWAEGCLCMGKMDFERAGRLSCKGKAVFAEGFIGREVPKNAFFTKFFSFPPLTKGKRYGMLVLLK